MAESIDVHDLPEEDVKFVKQFVEFLRERVQRKGTLREEKITFAAWPLGVKGEMSRREIYDHL